MNTEKTKNAIMGYAGMYLRNPKYLTMADTECLAVKLLDGLDCKKMKDLKTWNDTAQDISVEILQWRDEIGSLAPDLNDGDTAQVLAQRLVENIPALNQQEAAHA